MSTLDDFSTGVLHRVDLAIQRIERATCDVQAASNRAHMLACGDRAAGMELAKRLNDGWQELDAIRSDLITIADLTPAPGRWP